jgi:hypothetical protein
LLQREGEGGERERVKKICALRFKHKISKLFFCIQTREKKIIIITINTSSLSAVCIFIVQIDFCCLQSIYWKYRCGRRLFVWETCTIRSVSKRCSSLAILLTLWQLRLSLCISTRLSVYRARFLDICHRCTIFVAMILRIYLSLRTKRCFFIRRALWILFFITGINIRHCWAW